MKLHRQATAAVAALILATPVSGQTRAVLDSVLSMNRSGQWLPAVQLARNGLPGAQSMEERCALRISMIYGLARLGMAQPGSSELQTFDSECTGTQVAREWQRDIAEIRAIVAVPPLPKTGLDFTSVDEFWRVVDMMQRGETPGDADWRSLLRSPGYRLAVQNLPTVREDIAVTFTPGRRAEFDSLTGIRSDRAFRLRHLARALPLRARLKALRDSLATSPVLAAGVRGAARFLPAGVTDGRDPPLVAVAVFNNDGYASDDGAVVDLLYILDNGLEQLLAHEFHHVYGAALSRLRMPPPDSADFQLVGALSALRTEGIADMIDKPYPLTMPNPEMSMYVTRYRDVYNRTPSILRSVDSLLVKLSQDPSQARTTGMRVRALLWSNAHPNGAYMARTILENLGHADLMGTIDNPFDFIRSYAAAERKRGNPPPFSPAAVQVLDALERKYVKQP